MIIKIKIIQYTLVAFSLLIMPVQVLAASSADQKAADYDTSWYTPVGEDTGTNCTLGNTISSTLPSSVPAAYAAVFTAAAAAYQTNPNYLAALFVTEHGNNWPNPAGPWAGSPTGAQGPFQFEPGTWQAYKVDGNNDGVIDVQNLTDAAYSAANMVHTAVTTTTPLGDLTHPWKPGTILYAAGAYNAGGGTLQEFTTPNDPLVVAGLTQQVENYVANVYYLLTTNFAHGNPGYGNAAGTVTDNSGGTASAQTSVSQAPQNSCSTGVANNSIVGLALGLSWSDGVSHGLSPKTGTDATNDYIIALNQYDGGGAFGGADCGSFVATVVIGSGADPNYPHTTTGVQEAYIKAHPEKYQSVPNLGNTSDLQPGDIFIGNYGSGTGGNGHTFIYTGTQPNHTNAAMASLGTDMPYQTSVFFSEDLGGGDQNFDIYRIIK